jgi:SAM-dependent methyltransferase
MRVGSSLPDMSRHLGQDKSLIDRRLPFRAYRRLFGSEDMHSHYRWAAVSPLVDRRAGRTLEVGGGDGRIAFEVVGTGHRGEVVLSEPDPRTFEEARKTAELGGFTNVSVIKTGLQDMHDPGGFDQVLAIDVLEHIEDDASAVALLADSLKTGGRLVVSVPTPRYPEVFGRRFHTQIGHVRDGYWLEDLTRVLEGAGFVVDQHRYYTGKAVSRACRLFYASRIPYVVGVLWAPLVRPFLLRADTHVDAGHAASLAVVARRPS